MFYEQVVRAQVCRLSSAVLDLSRCVTSSLRGRPGLLGCCVRVCGLSCLKVSVRLAFCSGV